jgi:Fe-S cluster biogenesis protein NfuA
MKKAVEKILADIRPAIQLDGGDVELVDVDEKTGVVKVKLVGHCAHCPMSEYTLKMGIETRLIAEVPGVTEVINVN